MLKAYTLYNNTDNAVIKELGLGNQFRLIDNFREEELEGRTGGIKQFYIDTIDEEAL